MVIAAPAFLLTLTSQKDINESIELFGRPESY